MNCDVVSQWCVFADYPIFRMHMARHRDRFNKIILYPSRHHGYVDLEEFAKKVFPETWVDPVAIDYGVEDWRQAETDPCLKHVTSEWIMFSEADFFVEDLEVFYDKIEEAMKTSDAIGWWNDTHFPYLHPCCFFIKRELFERTNKDFRAHPEINGCDHFAMLTRDIERLGGKITKIQDLGYENWANAFHLGGLTYPYQNWKGDGSDVFGVGRPEIFYVYNYWMRKADVPQDPQFTDLSYKVENHMNLSIDPETSEWAKFFK